MSQNDNLLTDSKPYSEDGHVNVLIEIPAGTSEKWEMDKTNGRLKQDTLNGEPRIIHYLPYPGNYGMVPGTLLPKEQGGDGDPLDVIVLGPAVERGSIVQCKLIGILHLLDSGEKDDKLIAVMAGSSLSKVNNLEELNEKFKGVSEIVELWFSNYEGRGIIQSNGYGNREKAMEILQLSIEAYPNK